MADTEVTISVEEFIEQILHTDIAEAECWVKRSSASFPEKVWKGYLKQGMTRPGLQWFMSFIPIQISVSIEQLRLQKRSYKSMLSRGKAFLQEILQKAEKCGINVSGIRIGPISILK